jgi:hypothetical protein
MHMWKEVTRNEGQNEQFVQLPSIPAVVPGTIIFKETS